MDVVLSEEVARARAARLPLVAMESSVLAQGLPFPENLAAQRRCTAAVRGAGAIPALVAVLDGQVRCGLSDTEAESLARGKGQVQKVGARDLAPVVASQRSGGTTVSATCAVAGSLGLAVFATGGIGGVHPGPTGDVSEDLHALSQFSGMVVCSGAKSILDLPRTLEALESLGVLVVGFRTDEFPGFYVAGSGLRLVHRVEDAASAAQLLHIHRDRLGQSGALLLCVAPPPEVALQAAELEVAIRTAREVAARRGVSGPALTPFLLHELGTSSGGKTLQANLGLLEQNARVAAEVAVAYARGR